MKLRIEIRAAEGGDDSKMFAEDLMSAYIRLAEAQNWKTARL